MSVPYKILLLSTNSTLKRLLDTKERAKNIYIWFLINKNNKPSGSTNGEFILELEVLLDKNFDVESVNFPIKLSRIW